VSKSVGGQAASRTKSVRADPDKIVRHRGPDRLFHWVMAASVVALIATGFLPVLGYRFSWVAPHWIAGLILLAAVLFHLVRAVTKLDLKSMWIDRADLANAARKVRMPMGRRAAAGRPGKYLLAQKLFHHGVSFVLIVTIVTGLLMMVRVDTPFWTRNPYWLSDHAWGLVYVAHGLAALVLLPMLMLHVYFALRPEKLYFTRSMILGWITRSEYDRAHDPQRWRVAPADGLPPTPEGRGAAATATAEAGGIEGLADKRGEA
jgi:formate dehydrogenase subunit gamma